MGIQQITLFECDDCGRQHFKAEEPLLHDEDPVCLPGGEQWRYCGWAGAERLLCEECVEKYRQERLSKY